MRKLISFAKIFPFSPIYDAQVRNGKKFVRQKFMEKNALNFRAKNF